MIFFFQLDSSIVKCWGMGFKLEENSMLKKYCEFIPSPEPLIPIIDNINNSSFNSSVIIPERCKPKNLIGVPNSCEFLFYQTSLSDSTVGIILLVVSLAILCSSLVCIVKILNSLLKGNFILNGIFQYVSTVTSCAQIPLIKFLFLTGSIAKVIKKVINADIPYVPWLTGYIAILVGAVLTFIVQSSSVFTSTLTPLIGKFIVYIFTSYSDNI